MAYKVEKMQYFFFQISFLHELTTDCDITKSKKNGLSNYEPFILVSLYDTRLVEIQEVMQSAHHLEFSSGTDVNILKMVY